jgi:hypothetical protein
MKYIFGDITLFNSKTQYKYTEPFKVLKKVVDITNESSLEFVVAIFAQI